MNKILPAIPTNLLTVDWGVIGCGGIPKGFITEIFGPEMSGKTTFGLHVIAQCQKGGGIGAIIDAEHALNVKHAADLGVKIDELLISQPDYGEQALDIADKLIENEAADVILIDSVAGLVPQAELEGDYGDAQMGLQARLMSQAMRKLNGKVHEKQVALIFINQIREKLGVMFGNPETTTGGRALKFWSTLRIELRRVAGKDGYLYDAVKTDNIIGHKTKIKAVKNRVGMPYRETEVNLYYEKGYDIDLDLVNYAVKLGVVTTRAGWYEFNGEKFRLQDLDLVKIRDTALRQMPKS